MCVTPTYSISYMYDRLKQGAGQLQDVCITPIDSTTVVVVDTVSGEIFGRV
jgi:hypothetical protein